MKYIAVGMMLLVTACSTYNNGELETVDLSKYDELMEFHNGTMDKIIDELKELDSAVLMNKKHSSEVIKNVILEEMTVHHKFNEDQILQLRHHINEQVVEIVDLEPQTTVYQYSLEKLNKKLRNKSSEGFTLSDAQIEVFSELHSRLEYVHTIGEAEEVADKINQLAIEKLSQKEREIVFMSTAMLKNSVNYWFEHQDEWFSLMPESVRQKVHAMPDPWYITVGKADMIGLVVGAVEGFILGGIYGSIGGPAGTLLGALGGATLGSVGTCLTASSGAAFSLLF